MNEILTPLVKCHLLVEWLSLVFLIEFSSLSSTKLAHLHFSDPESLIVNCLKYLIKFVCHVRLDDTKCPTKWTLRCRIQCRTGLWALYGEWTECDGSGLWSLWTTIVIFFDAVKNGSLALDRLSVSYTQCTQRACLRQWDLHVQTSNSGRNKIISHYSPPE